MVHMQTAALHEKLEGHSAVKASSNRSFGLVIGGIFVLLAVAPLLGGGTMRAWAGIAAVIFASTAWLVPSALGPLNRVWTKLGLLLGKVVNPIVLTLLYLLVFTPMAMLMRALGKDVLRLRDSKSGQSYWLPREITRIEPQSMKHQF